MASVREPLFQSVNVRVVRVAHRSAATVVTFGNYADRAEERERGFGEAFLDDRAIDAIHVLPAGNDWFQYPEMPAAIAAIRAALGTGRRAFAYGSSMGGYAALRFAGALGAEAAIAISPQYSIERKVVPFERRWRAEARRLRFLAWPASRPEPPAILFFDPHGADARHVALWVRERAVVQVPLPYAGHPATTFLAETGLLARTLIEIVEGRFDPRLMAEEAKAARRRSAQYHAMLARAQPPWRRRTMLALAARAVALAPASALVLGRYAALLYRAGEDEAAERAHRAALALAPDDPLALFRLSRFLQRTRRFEEASLLARRAAALDPGSAALARHATTLARTLDSPLSPARAGNLLLDRANRLGWRRGWPLLDRLERP